MKTDTTRGLAGRKTTRPLKGDGYIVVRELEGEMRILITADKMSPTIRANLRRIAALSARVTDEQALNYVVATYPVSSSPLTEGSET